ncbi:MAG: hypothetical protein ACOCQP_02775 [Lentisphaeria bacterium]
MKRSRPKLINLLMEWELLLFVLILGLLAAHFLLPFFGRDKVDAQAEAETRTWREEGMRPLQRNNDNETFGYNQYALLEMANVITTDIQPRRAGNAFFIYQNEGDDDSDDKEEPDAEVEDKQAEEEPKTIEHEIEYCGKLRSPGGNEVALIKDVNSGKTVYRKVNSQLLNLTIVDFNGYDLTVKLPSGETETIFFNENFKFETVEK